MICNNYEPADKSRAEIQMMSCMVQWYSVKWGKCQLVEILSILEEALRELRNQLWEETSFGKFPVSRAF